MATEFEQDKEIIEKLKESSFFSQRTQSAIDTALRCMYIAEQYLKEVSQENEIQGRRYS